MKALLINKIVITDHLKSNSYFEKKEAIYTFLNPVSYLDALKYEDLFSMYDGIFADGSLLVAAIKICYGKIVKRRSFDMTSLAPLLFNYALTQNKTIYIVASKQEQVERAVEMIKGRYKGINIIGCRNGYFSDEREQIQEAKHITELDPDFVIVGMGIILQEKFLLHVKKAGYKGIGFTCGGFIHQMASNQIDYYPEWVDRMNLRFLYRMYKEPHTRKRYILTGLIFPARFVWERLFG